VLGHNALQQNEVNFRILKRDTVLSSQNPSRSPRYAEAVPAVLRTLDVLEHLESVPDGLTLSQISRGLRISPSSVSAILRTLAHRGYLVRDATTGRYRLGPNLGELAGESVAQRAIQHAAEAVVALAQASGASGPASPADRQRETLRALGLAGRHLAALLLDVEESSIPGRVVPEPVWHAEASGPLGPAELARFLEDEWLATLSCLGENGYPYSVPVWYHWENERFWVVPRARAEWARYLEQNPRVSLAISEPHPPLRRVLVEGDAEPLTGPGSAERALALSARLASRYLGPAAASYLEATAMQPRRVFTIVPVKLVTWHGLAPHPRYQAARHPSTHDQGVA